MPKPFFDAVREANPNYMHLSDGELQGLLEKQYGRETVNKSIMAYMGKIKPDSIQQAVTQKVKKKDLTGIDDMAAQARAQLGPVQKPVVRQPSIGERINNAMTPVADKIDQIKALVPQQSDRTTNTNPLWDQAAKYLPNPNQTWTPPGEGISPYSKVGDAVMKALKAKKAKELEQGYMGQ